MNLARFRDLDCPLGPSFLRLPMVPVSSAGNLFQNVFRKHTMAAEFDSLLDKLKQHVFTFLTNGRYMPHVDDDFAVEKVRTDPFPGTPQLRHPGPHERAFHNQPPFSVAFNSRNLQHGCFLRLSTT